MEGAQFDQSNPTWYTGGITPASYNTTYKWHKIYIFILKYIINTHIVDV